MVPPICLSSFNKRSLWYIEEGIAILLLFTFWRGWGHDVIVIHQLSKEGRITVKILHFHRLALYSGFVFEYSENKNK